MTCKVPVLTCLFAVLLLTLGSVAMAEHSQVPVVRIHTRADIAASPATVWAWMTQGKNLVTWCPEWKAPANARASITKIGDVLDYTDQWGNGGRSVVTYMVKGKELRVAHEPTKGDYICQAKFILEPDGAGTRVTYWEQYTDESLPTDVQATAQKMEAEIANMLASLKKGVEKK